MNVVTILLAAILIYSLLQGVHRGFKGEFLTIINQLISLLSGVVCGLLAWKLSSQLSLLVTKVNPSKFPQWTHSIVVRWQEDPNIAQLVAFVLLYILLTSSVRHFIGCFRTRSKGAGERISDKRRVLGGALGLLLGTVRVTGIGAILYVSLQYFSLPSLAAALNQSTLYTTLAKDVYAPWVNPWISRELPVLQNGALGPLSQGLNLFVVPTSLNGSKAGVLLVPKPIASLAESITSSAKTSRGKAYDIYQWEIQHIHYDWNKYDDFVYKHHWDGQSPLKTLQSKQGVCADYALLYADLAHSVGLSVKIDEGIGGTSKESGPHAWNEVYDPQAKAWINVDTTWGSEQDAWFGPPDFGATHALQTSIYIPGGTI